MAAGTPHDSSNGRREARTPRPPIACSLGEIADLSATGARISLRRRPVAGVGEVIDLSFGDGVAPARARIVWIRRKGLFRHEVGIEFVADDPPRTLSLSPAPRPVRRSA